jgi:hypothetical protein
MRILFDQGTPAPLRHSLIGHTVLTAYEQGWSALNNGALLAAAEAAAGEVMITTDQNLGYQQNLSQRRIAILVLPTTRWPRIKTHIPQIVDALNLIRPGDYRELEW